MKTTELFQEAPGESSEAIKERTNKARVVQSQRLADMPIRTNAQMNHKQLKKYCPLSPECKELLKKAIEELQLSARAYDKIIKITRTIADLEGTQDIRPEHMAEAIQYRSLDRNW